MKSQEQQDCIRDCLHCHSICLESAIEHGAARLPSPRAGRPVTPSYFQVMLDCAEICQTTANFLLRGSPLHAAVCSLCAEICDTCAQKCQEAGGMGACVQACRHCATACRQAARQ
jgi:hypothetical protein